MTPLRWHQASSSTSPEAAFQRRSQATGERQGTGKIAHCACSRSSSAGSWTRVRTSSPRSGAIPGLMFSTLPALRSKAAYRRRRAGPGRAVDAAVSLLAGDLEQQAVAVGQFVDHRATLFHHLAHLPLAAAVEQGQAARLPLPFRDEPLHRQVLPALLRLALATAELAPDLEVQAAPREFQAFRRLLFPQVAFEMAIDQDVGSSSSRSSWPANTSLEAQGRRSGPAGARWRRPR